MPAIVRWPGVIKAGSTSETPWAFWDILPTVAELAGTTTPGSIDGISIAPVLLGRQAGPRDCFYWEFHEKGFHQAVRKGDWKLVRQGGNPPELFDLKKDVSERDNLAAQHSDVVTALAKLFDSERVESDKFPVKR